MTPSRPTLSIAWARILPTAGSLFAAMVAICRISSEVLTGRDSFARSATMASTAFLMPRARSMEFAPAAMFFKLSLKMASARTVAVVVPSPATSEVLLATSLTSFAPRFSNLSFSSTSSATLTPSLVTVGAPQPLSRIAVIPLGPSVALTALASFSTPTRSFPRASSSNANCFAAIAL